MSIGQRVTQRTITSSMMNGLQANLDRMQDLQAQLSSGKQIRRPSDSPVGTVAAMTYRSEIQRNEQYGRNAQDALGWLATADSTLSNIHKEADKANQLLMSSMNGALGPDALSAIATQLEGIRDGMIVEANKTYLNRPIFGGTTTDRMAFDATGAYVGNSAVISRTVGPGSSVAISMPGNTVFASGSSDLFAEIDAIVNHLRNDPAQLQADLGKLATSMERIRSKQAEIGARQNRVETEVQNSDDRKIELTSGLSSVEDIDLPATIIQVQMQQVAYQAALGATAKAIQPSLVDFLR